MTAETYDAIYGNIKIDTETTVSLYEAPSNEGMYTLYLRIKNRLIDEHFVMLNTDGEVNASDLIQVKRDLALISMTVKEVRDMVYRYIAIRSTETFGSHVPNSATLKRVNGQVKKFMRYYETEILPRKSSLYGKQL